MVKFWMYFGVRVKNKFAGKPDYGTHTKKMKSIKINLKKEKMTKILSVTYF